MKGDERWPFVDILEGIAMPRCSWTRSCQWQPLRKRKLTASFSNFPLGMCQRSQLIVQNQKQDLSSGIYVNVVFPTFATLIILNDVTPEMIQAQDSWKVDQTLTFLTQHFISHHTSLGTVISQREQFAFNGAICHPEKNQRNICWQARSIPDFG